MLVMLGQIANMQSYEGHLGAHCLLWEVMSSNLKLINLMDSLRFSVVIVCVRITLTY